ncbi:hypothetical protein B551_0209575 [Cupriavidus sp. HPC(L)]|nr:hypothetical protein B551_0209575 [Cupriavidus sp. HPC(L)]
MWLDPVGMVRVSADVLDKQIQGVKKHLARYLVGRVRGSYQQDGRDAQKMYVGTMNGEVMGF